MKNLLRTVVKQRRQFLMDQLVQSGVYKKNNKHLYEWTLSDLEEEYKYIFNLESSKKEKYLHP
ncbi:Fur-regulated basic protein FbpA [Neobacillus citreus]|uniref:Fur-regulated basic protein FbpA n=1 Tax=Neobacillus citreus TaxID=2833578 RepID=A0A942YBM3_9BACI|nr:Fur-regulated basic protein FbpA [Neobacillus citreus]MCH6264428.1 Fur-regulated basic protein FbpA [Neobacillus citreus]